MDISDIQTRVDALGKGMAAKALTQANASFYIQSHAKPTVCLSWASKATSLYGDKTEWFHGTSDDVLAKAEAYVAGLPSPEEARMSAFLSALSDTIALGKQNDIDGEFVSPLMALMKKLSKNALVSRIDSALGVKT